MDLNSAYIEIPFGTLCCFLFLFFCFLNAPRTQAIRAIRSMIFFCIVWTGGDVLTRIQLYPGESFWYSISLLGLLMIPPFIYFFLFDVLEMQKKKLLNIFSLVSLSLGITNFVICVFITGIRRNGSEGAYANSFATYLLLVIETLFLLYVTVLAHKKIGNRIYLRSKLVPLLVGSISILVANMAEVSTTDKYPYSCYGGLMLAVCVAYLLCRRYLFDISHRLWVGLNYMLGVAIVVLPIWLISRTFDRIVASTGFTSEQVLLFISLIVTIWAVLGILTTIKLARNAEKELSEKQFLWLQEIQEKTLSIFDAEELCQKIIDAIPNLIKDAAVRIVVHTNDFDDYMRFGEEKQPVYAGKPFLQLQEEYQQLKEEKDIELAPIYCEDKFQGYISLCSLRKHKSSHLELECIQQLAAHISVCMKNIQIYQTRYQMTVRDDLTGLYNRRYFKEYLEKRWDKGIRGSFVYFDIDNFKLFNEIYGESLGDDILKWCGKVITEEADEKDLVFRMGSNEYLVYTREGKKQILQEFAKAVQRRLAEETEEKPKVLQQITMSIGIALSSERVNGFNELLKHAERASFFAKQKGKNCIELYGETDLSREEQIKNISAYEQVSSTVNALTAAINAKDSYTFGHSMHVSQYAVMLARELGLDSNEVRIVKEAGLLHDIGKIGIPEHILQKQGRLTDEEYKIMKSHVTKSVEMIHFLPNMSYVIPAVISHHERYDGKGYPRGLAGEQIPLLGRILAVCDCYDAMVSKRSYKEAFSKEYATEELIKNKGTQFDPDLVDIFVTLIPHIKNVEETDKAG